jgi:hypothetical protein
MFVIPVFGVNLHKDLPVALAITTCLPHVAVPLGWDTEFWLEMLFDSGAGISIGLKGYHLATAKLIPQCVVEVVEFAEHNIRTLPVGGVAGASIEVTATIT